MKSLFLRIFLWFCGGAMVLVLVITSGLMLTMPDVFSTGWRRIGRAAVVLTARTAVEKYEQSGAKGLSEYVQKVATDMGLHPQLFDSSGRPLVGSGPEAAGNAVAKIALSENQLAVSRGGIASVRIAGRSGALYTFVTPLPPRDERIVASPGWIATFILVGVCICYLLARNLSTPMLRLRTLTSLVASGDLTARIPESSLLHRGDEIGGLARDFNHMAARIESLMMAQKRLVADVSHELRSPLTRLRLALGLLRRELDDAPVSLSRMEREIHRLNGLIEQLLALSQLECASDLRSLERLDLAEVLQEVAADAAFEAQSVNRKVRLAGCEPAIVMGIRGLLVSGIENVIRNAVRYTRPETEVVIRLSRPSSTGQAVITVEDCGPGVPESELEHIFEPFYRISEARDRNSGGAGLGLAIADRVIKLHGGSVRAANRDGGGLSVSISLLVLQAA